MERKLNELELVIWCVSEPEWSVMIILRESGDTCTDIECLIIRKQKRTIRRWRLDKFGDALQAEVEAFSEGRNEGE